MRQALLQTFICAQCGTNNFWLAKGGEREGANVGPPVGKTGEILAVGTHWPKVMSCMSKN